MLIHPSHRGLKYIRRPPQKKKRKKKAGGAGAGAAAGFGDPSFGADQQPQGSIYGPGPDGGGAYQDPGYSGDGRDGSPPGRGGEQDRSPVGGAGGYRGDGDDRSDMGRGGAFGAAGAQGRNRDQSAVSGQGREKIDYRGGGGAKRYFGDIDSEAETPWELAKGITKRPKKAKKVEETVEETPKRNQRELYVDYNKMVEIDEQQIKIVIRPEEDDPDKFWELIDPEDEDMKQYIDDNYVTYLSWRKVKQHQQRMHPRKKNGAMYGCCEADISFLPMCMCCIKGNKWITPAAREIGIGPTLFLMTQKAFAYMFFLFMIINIPLIIFYSAGHGGVKDDKKDAQFTDVFGQLSIGNLGVSDYACANLNIAKVGYNSFDKKKLQFNCPYGTMRNFTQYGIQKKDNQSCTDNNGFFLGEGNKTDDL